MFKVDEKEIQKATKLLEKDIGNEVVDKIKKALEDIKGFLTEDVAEQIRFYPQEGVVGSESEAPNAINEGVMPGTYPDFDKIYDWVRNVKDGGKNSDLPDYKIRQIAYKVSKKIHDEGIEPEWFVDKALFDVEKDNEYNTL